MQSWLVIWVSIYHLDRFGISKSEGTESHKFEIPDKLQEYLNYLYKKIKMRM